MIPQAYKLQVHLQIKKYHCFSCCVIISILYIYFVPDILNQMNEMTTMLSTSKITQLQSTNQGDAGNDKETKNVLRINVNNQNTTIAKHIWNIPVNVSIMEMPLEDSASNTTQPSNVDTLERIHDLEYVESKLNSLKSQLETSL